MRDIDALVLGMCCVDVLIRGADFSTPWGAESKIAEETMISVGGDALNEARVLGRLGARTVLETGVGDDAGGTMLRSMVAECGVDVSRITVPMKTSPMNVVCIQPDGQRNFVNTGEEGYGDYEMATDLMPRARIVSLASLLVAPLNKPERTAKLAKAAHDAGCILCADTGRLRGKYHLEDFSETLKYVDYFFPNDSEAKEISGKDTVEEAAVVLAGFGIKNVVIKVGAKGCYLYNSEGGRYVPGYTHLPVVDTTGAGDNFAAGTIFALSRGKTPEEALRFGCGVAAVSIGYVGASTGVKSLQQVLEALASAEK